MPGGIRFMYPNNLFVEVMIMNNIEDYPLVYGGKSYGIVSFQLLDNKMIRLIIKSSGEDLSSFIIQKQVSGIMLGISPNYWIVPNSGTVPDWFNFFHSIDELKNHINKSMTGN